MATDRQNHLLQTAYNAGITSPKELANFMAQVGHESGNLSRLNESFRYTQSAEQISSVVRSAMREGRASLEEARLEALDGKPQALAELMYGGRMGNDQPGDGYKYRGRGYIQLTGKNQYEAAGQALGMDLVKNPDLAAEPENAARIAVWYWQQNVPVQSRENVRTAGAAINGANPPNGLADREQKFDSWQARLTPELMDTLQAGSLGRGIPAPAAPAIPAGGIATPAPELRAVQEKLNALGYRDPQGQPLLADNIHGPKTAHAVRAFQQDHGLAVDGRIGPQTLAALASQKLLAQAGNTGPAVQTLQSQLNQLGMTDAQGRALSEDGRFGPRTGQAVEAFQKANGLTVDGVVGPQTRQALENALQKAPQQATPAPAAALQDMPLFQKLKGCMPDGLSLEKIGQATTCAFKAGIDSAEKVQQVHVNGNTAYVIGTTAGFRASVDLASNPPSLDVSSQQLLALDQAREQQHSHTASMMRSA